MVIHCLQLFTLLLYSIVASQSFSYILSLQDVQLRMNAPAYISFRKDNDRLFRRRFRFVLYACLCLNALLVVACCRACITLPLVTSAISLLGLLADIALAVKGNLPINRLINSWSAEAFPPDWQQYRAAWLRYFQKRQVANIGGFVSLSVGVVFS